MTVKKTAQFLAVTAVLAISANSFAAESQPIERVSVKVPFYDLDVQSYEGARTLYSRLQRASRRACGVRQARSLRETSDARRCYTQSLTAAVDGVDSEVLRLLHRG